MGNAFGYNQEEKSPCCHCMPVWCIGSNIAADLSLCVQQLNVRCETKTKDNVCLLVVTSVHYRALADETADGYYKLSNIREQIQAYVFDVIRASFPSIELDSVFNRKNEVAKSLEGELQKAMSIYGYKIVRMLIVDIEIDASVMRSLREKSAASREQHARKEDEAISIHFSAKGVRWQRKAIVDGVKESLVRLSSEVPGISTKDAINMILRIHYFDTMEKIAATSKSTYVFIPHGEGAVKDFAAQMRGPIKPE